jgi:hypothetical protein
MNNAERRYLSDKTSDHSISNYTAKGKNGRDDSLDQDLKICRDATTAAADQSRTILAPIAP